MDILTTYHRAGLRVMKFFRWDLQLHFFWGFILTLPGAYWPPLYSAGIVLTLIKEGLDLWSKGRWSWDDVWWGIAGSVLALIYLYPL